MQRRHLYWFCAAVVILILMAIGMSSPITGVDSGLKWLGAKQFSTTNSLTITPAKNGILSQQEFPPCPEPFLYLLNGKLYPVFAVIPIILNGYVDRLLGDRFWWLWSVLPTLILLFIFFSETKKLSIDPLWATFALLLATPLSIYAVTYWEHALAATIASVGIISLSRKKTHNAVLAGILLGLGPWIRVELLGWGVLAGIFAIGFIPWKNWVTASFCFMFSLVCGLIVNHLMTGNWFPLQVIANYETGQTLLSDFRFSRIPWEAYFEMLIGAGSVWVSIALLLLTIAGIVGWRKQNNWVVALMIIPIVYFITRLLDPLPVFHMLHANGLLYTFPVIVFAGWGWKRLPAARIWLGAALGLFGMVLLMGGVIQGIHWSVRYLLPLSVPVAFAALLALKERSIAPHNLAIGIAGILCVTIYGWIWHNNIAHRQIEFAATMQADSVLIASDVSWLGGDLAPLLATHEIVYVGDRERIGRMLITLKANQRNRFQFVRMASAVPLYREGNRQWLKLIKPIVRKNAPTPEADHYYRVEEYELCNDSLAYSRLAGECAALRLSRGDPRGIDDARLALIWALDDVRPAIQILSYGVENNDIALIREGRSYLDAKPVPEKFRSLIEQADRMILNNKK